MRFRWRFRQFAANEKKLLTSQKPFDTKALDYVTRRVNASLAGLKKPVGLDLRWDTALRDLQIQLEPESARG